MCPFSEKYQKKNTRHDNVYTKNHNGFCVNKRTIDNTCYEKSKSRITLCDECLYVLSFCDFQTVSRKRKKEEEEVFGRMSTMS